MAYSDTTRQHAMNCNLQGCPGEYEERDITHTVKHRGKIVVIDHVPAEVCTLCEDVLLRPETVRHIEALLRASTEPARMVPLYEYA
jgi:YgiT-type zinc finger domain-containing protein